jgi:hypothetical protein
LVAMLVEVATSVAMSYVFWVMILECIHKTLLLMICAYFGDTNGQP